MLGPPYTAILRLPLGRVSGEERRTGGRERGRGKDRVSTGTRGGGTSVTSAPSCWEIRILRGSLAELKEARGRTRERQGEFLFMHQIDDTCTRTFLHAVYFLRVALESSFLPFPGPVVPPCHDSVSFRIAPRVVRLSILRASFRRCRKLFASVSRGICCAKSRRVYLTGAVRRLTADLRHPPRRRAGVRFSLKTDKIVSKEEEE